MQFAITQKKREIFGYKSNKDIQKLYATNYTMLRKNQRSKQMMRYAIFVD